LSAVSRLTHAPDRGPQAGNRNSSAKSGAVVVGWMWVQDVGLAALQRTAAQVWFANAMCSTQLLSVIMIRHALANA
jgi:hypothetical protein